MDSDTIIVKNADLLGGEPVFVGSRVPVKILFEYLEGGDTIDKFIDQYPSVSKEKALAVLKSAELQLIRM